MNWYLVSGIVVVVGLACALLMPVIYGVWDLVRIRKGENLGVTASSWMARFLQRHPIVAFCAGLSIGILAAHFGWPVTACLP